MNESHSCCKGFSGNPKNVPDSLMSPEVPDVPGSVKEADTDGGKICVMFSYGFVTYLDV